MHPELYTSTPVLCIPRRNHEHRKSISRTHHRKLGRIERALIAGAQHLSLEVVLPLNKLHCRQLADSRLLTLLHVILVRDKSHELGRDFPAGEKRCQCVGQRSVGREVNCAAERLGLWFGVRC